LKERNAYTLFMTSSVPPPGYIHTSLSQSSLCAPTPFTRQPSACHRARLVQHVLDQSAQRKKRTVTGCGRMYTPKCAAMMASFPLRWWVGLMKKIHRSSTRQPCDVPSTDDPVYGAVSFCVPAVTRVELTLCFLRLALVTRMHFASVASSHGHERPDPDRR
jgi:hypothetical protein